MTPAVLEIPQVNKFGSPDQRAEAAHRKPLENAERKAQEAAQRVEAEREALSAKVQRIEALRAKRGHVVERLANLERMDLEAQRVTCNGIVSELLGSNRLVTEPARLVELDAAVKVLAELPAVEKLLPGIVAAEKAKLAEIDAELAALESSK
jgi:hypothetical protein